MEKYDDIWGYAEDHFGLITIDQAKELGVSNAHLVMMERRGTLLRVGRGVYQVKHHVVGPNDSYACAVAVVGKGAYLRGASVLGLLRVVPTDLSVLFVGTDRRVRRRLPDYVNVKESPNPQVCGYEGIPCERIDQAIVSAAKDGSLDVDRVKEAIAEALERGLINRKLVSGIRKEVLS